MHLPLGESKFLSNHVPSNVHRGWNPGVFYRNCRTFQTFNQEKRACRWVPHLPRNTFRRCQKHSMASQQEPSERPDCTTREESSFFHSADGSLNYSICLGSTWRWTCHAFNTFRRKIEKSLSVWIVLGFSIRVTESLQTHHGLRLGKVNVWIRFVNKPCTTTAYLHCHLDSLSSVRMLQFADMTSAKTVAAKCTVLSGIKLTSALSSDILCFFAHVAIRIFRNMCEYVMFSHRLARF